METWEKVLLSIIGLIIISSIYLGISESKSKKNTCKEIGLEEFIYEDRAYCEDSEGNLHYVKLDCPLPPFTRCIVKPISIGNVRTINSG